MVPGVNHYIPECFSSTHSHPLAFVDCCSPCQSQWNLQTFASVERLTGTIGTTVGSSLMYSGPLYPGNLTRTTSGTGAESSVGQWPSLYTMFTTVPTAPLNKPQSAFKLTTSITLLSRQRYSRGNNPPALLLSASTACLPL